MENLTSRTALDTGPTGQSAGSFPSFISGRVLLAAIFGAVAALPAFGQAPRADEDPAAGLQHAPRGSQQELEIFGQHLLPFELEPSTGPIALPADAEVQSSLKADERPSLQFLKKGKLSGEAPKLETPKAGGYRAASAGSAPAPLPQHENKLENPLIRQPGDFLVEYELKAEADITVTITDMRGMPVSSLVIPAGTPGGLKGQNSLIYWDGRDLEGREAPEGRYMAVQSIRYAGEEKEEIRELLLIK